MCVEILCFITITEDSLITSMLYSLCSKTKKKSHLEKSYLTVLLLFSNFYFGIKIKFDSILMWNSQSHSVGNYPASKLLSNKQKRRELP